MQKWVTCCPENKNLYLCVIVHGVTGEPWGEVSTSCPLVLASSVLWLGASFVHYVYLFLTQQLRYPFFTWLASKLSYLINCFCHCMQRKDLLETNFLILAKWSAFFSLYRECCSASHLLLLVLSGSQLWSMWCSLVSRLQQATNLKVKDC